jgi:hypothetical protein
MSFLFLPLSTPVYPTRLIFSQIPCSRLRIPPFSLLPQTPLPLGRAPPTTGPTSWVGCLSTPTWAYALSPGPASPTFSNPSQAIWSSTTRASPQVGTPPYRTPLPPVMSSLLRYLKSGDGSRISLPLPLLSSPPRPCPCFHPSLLLPPLGEDDATHQFGPRTLLLTRHR